MLLLVAWQSAEAMVPVLVGVVIDRAVATGDTDALLRWIAALAVLSARDPDRTRTAVEQRGVPVYALVSVEDRDGLRATVDAYLAAPSEGSRLDVFHGLGVGITMASVLQFERPAEQQLDARLTAWFAGVLTSGR